MLNWQWSSFSKLSASDVYQIAVARQTVFINEQQCLYLDLDSRDQQAWHLIAWEKNAIEKPQKKLSAYLRVIKPGVLGEEAILGRLLVVKEKRGAGLAKQLMELALVNIQKCHPDTALRISAQVYLQDFYKSFGFKVISDVYDEDGILHIDMLKP